MASLSATPKNGRIKFSDGAGTPVTLVAPYTNGDFAESGDTNSTGHEVEVVYCRDVPVDLVTTKQSGKKLTFTALATMPGSTETIEDWIYSKGTYAALTTTAPAGFMSLEKLYKVEWQVNIGGVWTTVKAYNYCHIRGNVKEGSPVGTVDIQIDAIACDGSWITITST